MNRCAIVCFYSNGTCGIEIKGGLSRSKKCTGRRSESYSGAANRAADRNCIGINDCFYVIVSTWQQRRWQWKGCAAYKKSYRFIGTKTVTRPRDIVAAVLKSDRDWNDCRMGNHTAASA